MTEFIYRPENATTPDVQNATLGVKFAQRRVILDEGWLFGGTKWSRSLCRLRHPIVYSKRGLRNIYRRIKRLFVGDPPMIMCRKFISKEEASKQFPDTKDKHYGNDQEQKNTTQQDKESIRKGRR